MLWRTADLRGHTRRGTASIIKVIDIFSWAFVPQNLKDLADGGWAKARNSQLRLQRPWWHWQSDRNHKLGSDVDVNLPPPMLNNGPSRRSNSNHLAKNDNTIYRKHPKTYWSKILKFLGNCANLGGFLIKKLLIYTYMISSTPVIDDKFMKERYRVWNSAYDGLNARDIYCE